MTPADRAVDGLAVVDKPTGMTSHDVVARCRRALGTRKVGHAGTLDPAATGVLLVGAGRVTRLLRFMTALPKTYAGELLLGTATTTLDAEGEVVGTWDMSGVTPAQVAEAAGALTGAILQVPPMVSAVKVGGRRLHELARAGIEVERAPRPVTVRRFDVVPAGGRPGVYRFEVECTSGTYVRVLAADLGERLGGGASLLNLRRLAVGPFDLRGAVALDDVGPDRLLTPAEAVSFLPRREVDGAEAVDVGHGRPLAGEGEGPVAVVDDAGRLLAVYEPSGGALRAGVVVEPA